MAQVAREASQDDRGLPLMVSRLVHCDRLRLLAHLEPGTVAWMDANEPGWSEVPARPPPGSLARVLIQRDLYSHPPVKLIRDDETGTARR